MVFFRVSQPLSLTEIRLPRLTRRHARRAREFSPRVFIRWFCFVFISLFSEFHRDFLRLHERSGIPDRVRRPPFVDAALCGFDPSWKRKCGVRNRCRDPIQCRPDPPAVVSPCHNDVINELGNQSAAAVVSPCHNDVIDEIGNQSAAALCVCVCVWGQGEVVLFFFFKFHDSKLLVTSWKRRKLRSRVETGELRLSASHCLSATFHPIWNRIKAVMSDRDQANLLFFSRTFSIFNRTLHFRPADAREFHYFLFRAVASTPFQEAPLKREPQVFVGGKKSAESCEMELDKQAKERKKNGVCLSFYFPPFLCVKRTFTLADLIFLSYEGWHLPHVVDHLHRFGLRYFHRSCNRILFLLSKWWMGLKTRSLAVGSVSRFHFEFPCFRGTVGPGFDISLFVCLFFMFIFSRFAGFSPDFTWWIRVIKNLPEQRRSKEDDRHEGDVSMGKCHVLWNGRSCFVFVVGSFFSLVRLCSSSSSSCVMFFASFHARTRGSLTNWNETRNWIRFKKYLDF